MTRIQVQAGASLLEGYTKKPPTGLCELVWNAFDADAHTVDVSIENSSLGGLDSLKVTDDGLGMTVEQANKAFSQVGDSWKRMPGTKTDSGRPVHGKYGRGRYSAFSLGDSVTWISTARSIPGEWESLTVTGHRNHLQYFDIMPIEPQGDTSGTEVTVHSISDDAQKAFDEPESLRIRLLTEFALHLDRFPDFALSFLGSKIEPAKVINNKDVVNIALPDGITGEASLTVIEWNLTNVERRLYLCDTDGSVIQELTPSVQAPGTEFTAYLQWDQFVDHDIIFDSEDDAQTSTGRVIQAGRDALREYLKQAARKREAATIRRWKSEGIYPYKTEPVTTVEKASRSAFDAIAMAASRTVDESKTRNSKVLTLELLKETFESDPEALFPILKQVTTLPSTRIEELKSILSNTSLSQLIQAGHKVGSRVHFLNGLSEILFEKQYRKRVLERKQLHRIHAHETWVFGEEWALTGDDERLSVVLKKHLKMLADDTELAGAAEDVKEEILREDGSIAIPDLVLGRKRRTSENRYEHLVVELKRPNHKLTDEDVSQLRSYASAIVNDERFSQDNVSWEFVLVGNATSQTVDELREQTNAEYGVVQRSRKYTIAVRQWAEIIGDAEHRLKFVQESLQYESNKDKGLQYLREKYSEYLPTVEELDGIEKQAAS